MLIHFGQPKEQTFDSKAARQRFTDGGRSKAEILSIPPNTDNPIDVELRRYAIFNATGFIDLKALFFDKWAAVMTKHGTKTGRVKDIYQTRDVRLRDKYDKDIIVPFEQIIELKESEI